MEAGVPPEMAPGRNLPLEIIVDILSRLPPRPLIRFRSVSKSWNSLIRDPNFAKKHLNQRSRNLSLKKILLNGSSSMFTCDLSSLSNNFIKLDALRTPPTETMTPHIAILGCLNGLFCIFINGEMFLWNPSIQESRKLPSSSIEAPLDIDNPISQVYVCGFGYDSYDDDYKVVEILKISRQGLRTTSKMYSLKTNSWRKIEECPHLYYATSTGKFINGALYWTIDYEKQSGLSHLIISLELSKEKYAEIPFPDYSSVHTDPYEFDLAVLKGMLCLHCNYVQNYFVLWVMKDSGGVLWTQMFKILYSNVHVSYVPSHHYIFTPKYLFENNEILLQTEVDVTNKVLVMYKENGLGVGIKKNGGQVIKFDEAFVYDEGLVSPHVNKKLRATTAH